MGGRDLICLTVTAPGSAQEIAKRKGVVITARVHPTESNSSLVMKGVLDFLTRNSKKAALLRKNLVFKIVPMINVDGVALGNSRCNLSGQDLNRMWKKPSALFPECVAIKKMVWQLHQSNPVIFFADLHGHSRARKAFMYGNNYVHNPESTRLFPYILSKLNPQAFSIEKCRFSVQRQLEGTARIVFWRMLKTPAVYTLETSVCGASAESPTPHFTTSDLARIGKDLCLGLLTF